MLEINDATEIAPKVNDLPEAQFQLAKAGQSVTVPVNALVVILPAPEAFGKNKEGAATLFAKHYGEILSSATKKAISAGGEQLFASLTIYRKLKGGTKKEESKG